MISYGTSNASKSTSACLMCFAMAGGMILAAIAIAGPGQIASRPLLSNPPKARSPISLTAVNDPRKGKTSFSFNRREDPQIIRAIRGEDIRLTYIYRGSERVAGYTSIAMGSGK